MSLTSVSPNGLGAGESSNADSMQAMMNHHTEMIKAKAKPEIKKRSVMDELLVHDHHHHEHYRFVLHPFGFRRYWDVVTTLLVLYLCWRIPFDLGIDWWYPPKSLKSFEIFADIWFGVDIILNFRTGHIHDGHLVMSPKEIAKHYLEFWFWIDIIATIPFELFGALFENKSSRKAIKLVKWFKIPRLMRLGRVLKYLRQYAKFYKLILVTFAMLLSTHMFGCIFVAIIAPCAQYDYDYSGSIDTSVDGPCAQKNAFKVWARALHYGIAMLCGNSVRALNGQYDSEEIAGFEFHHTVGSDMWTYVAMLIGLWLMALFFGEVAVIAHHGDRYTWDFRVRLKRIMGTMSNEGLPDELQHRVKKYYDYLWLNNLHGSDALLEDSDMSAPLKKDISLYMYRDILKNVSFLQGASSDVVVRLCSLLKHVVYMPMEFAFCKGDRGHSLFIIKRGTVEVLRNEVGEKKDVVAELTTNNFFGETALLMGIGRAHGGHRACSTQAKTICELLELSIMAFNQIISEFPGFKEDMLAVSARRRPIVGKKKKGLRKRQTWVEDPDPAGSKSGPGANTMASSGLLGGGGSSAGASAEAVAATVRECVLEMRRDLEHSINDRLASLEGRLNHAIEQLSKSGEGEVM
jgi:hypothetical protein